jgi:tetratricopeptide (TPR) repeat protein
VVELDPQDYEAWNNLGNSYLEIGRNLNALDSYRKALRIKPDYDISHYNVGLVSLRLDDKGTAMREYDYLLPINKKLADALMDEITGRSKELEAEPQESNN